MLSLILYSLLCICFFLGSDCGKELVVTPPPPPPAVDTIITHGRELTDGEQPAVSPDGTRIAFTRNGDIYVCDTSGVNVMQLTSGVEVDLMPRWHPSGQTIGFIRKNQEEYNKGLLYGVAATGGVANQIISNQFIADWLMPGRGGNMPIWDWSPSGDLIGFLQLIDFKISLMVANISDNHVVYQKELYNYQTTSGGNKSCFVWSTNDEIAFIGQKSHTRSSVFLVNLITNQQYADTSRIFYLNLTKNPSANMFAYSTAKSQINVVSVGVIVVTDFSNTLDEYPVNGEMGGLKWSHDGRFFLFENPRYYPNPFGYRESRIGIYNIEQRKQYLLTQKGDIDRWNFFFDWGKNSREVYFERYKKINKVTFELVRR